MGADTTTHDGREEPVDVPPKRSGVVSTVVFVLAVAASVCVLLVAAVVAGGLSYLVAWFDWGGVATSVGAAVAGFLGVLIAIPAGIAFFWLFVPDPNDERSLLRTFAALFMSVVAMMIESAVVIVAAVVGGVIGVMLFRWMSPGWAAANVALVTPAFGLVVGIVVGSPPGESSE